MQANEQLHMRLEALKNQPSALAQAQAKQEEHIRDRDKFKTLIDNLQVCCSDTQLFIEDMETCAYDLTAIKLSAALKFWYWSSTRFCLPCIIVFC